MRPDDRGPRDEPAESATTVHVVVPSLMILGALVLRPRVNRIANIALSVVYALTIVAGAIGEWGYWIPRGAVEVALLAAIAYHTATWPRAVSSVRDADDRAEPAS